MTANIHLTHQEAKSAAQLLLWCMDTKTVPYDQVAIIGNYDSAETALDECFNIITRVFEVFEALQFNPDCGADLTDDDLRHPLLVHMARHGYFWAPTIASLNNFIVPGRGWARLRNDVEEFTQWLIDNRIGIGVKKTEQKEKMSEKTDEKQQNEPKQDQGENHPGEINSAPNTTNETCLWTGCTKTFNTQKELYDHLCNDHIGSNAQGNIDLSGCHWQGCGRSTFNKRDHATSHLKTHVKALRLETCSFCPKTFRRSQDRDKHMKNSCPNNPK